MKFGFIFILFNTPPSEVARLTSEVKKLNLKSVELVFVDNSNNGNGYSQGVNSGIKSLSDKNIDVYVIANPDISIKNLTKDSFINISKKFQVSSFAMKQNGKKYYCGELDKNRLTSYLRTNKPSNPYLQCTYITGSLMIIKSEVIEKIGLFDETYFMYYEDVDFCIRAKNEGFTIGLSSYEYYKHFEVSQSNKSKDIMLFYSWLKFFLKYSTSRQKVRECFRIPKTISQNKMSIFSSIKNLWKPIQRV